MKRINLEKTLSTVLGIAGPLAAASALSQPQGSYGMMHDYGGSWMGGYGGGWVLILLVAVIAGLVGWIVGHKSKVKR